MRRLLIIAPLLGLFLLACDGDDAGSSGSDFGVDMGESDRDNDGVSNGADNCPDRPNEDQADLDGDGVGDRCDPDDDGDGVLDEADGCPTVPDPERLDFDEDGLGDLCDDDDDNDGVSDDVDLCPFDATDMGADVDGDGLGDPCDFDIDGDEVRNEDDNCPSVANTAQEDQDGDGLGDGCDDDRDGDLVLDAEDNCPAVINPDQNDLDLDGVGDLCDQESDGDGIPDVQDNCPSAINPDQADEDMDAIGDACDVCRRDPANDQDEDGVCGDVDNCPNSPNADQVDDDEDSVGTACDSCPFDPLNDDDLDGVCGAIDNCIEDANGGQEDGDRDGIGDACDACPEDADNDHDQDGVCGNVDLCPLSADPDQLDQDEDGLGDACDICPLDGQNDADADSVCGDVDNCPDFSNVAQADDDGDGVGDACDECVAGGRTDPDGDARCGVTDNCPETPNPDQVDRDDDGFGDLCDICPGDPRNDADGDEVCGDLDTCPDVFDPGQANDDGDGQGNACDPDADNDGIADIDDNCPLTANEDQRDRYGDARGDACEFVYFYEDFELGLDRWTIGNGEWTVIEEAAYQGSLGLVDRRGNSLTQRTIRIDTPEIDLGRAERPRVSFHGRFALREYGFLVKVLGAEDEVLQTTEVVGPGNGSRQFRRYDVDLSAFAGQQVRVRLELRTGRNSGLGVWIDEFRVDEGPALPAQALPFREQFDSLAGWEEIGGDWTTTIHGAWSDSALTFAETETLQQGRASLKLKRPLDLRGVEAPVMSLWLRSADFDAQTNFVVEIRPQSPDVAPMFWSPRIGEANPYFEKYTLPIPQLAGEARADVYLHYDHWSNRRSWVIVDDLRVEERADVTQRAFPADIWIPDDEIEYLTGGWGVVEEPLGQPALRSSAFGLELESETRASLGHFDFSETMQPQASIWTRYALRADRQGFYIEARGDAFLERFEVLRPIGADLSNGQFERIDVDLARLNGQADIELVLVVENGNQAHFGVDVSRVLLGEREETAAVEAPVLWDFDEASPARENVSGRWGLSAGAGDGGTGALRLVSRLGLRGSPVFDHVRLLPPVDISGLDRPYLSLKIRHYNNALHHSFLVIIRTTDKGTWTEQISSVADRRSQPRSDGFQSYRIPLAPVAGSRAATIELYARTAGEEPLDVAVDDIVIDSAPAFPLADLSMDANNYYTLFINGEELGSGDRWLAGEAYQSPLQIGSNVIAIEVDGPADGPRVIGSLLFGDLLVRTGEPGWKSSMINPDGSFEQGWMNLAFDDFSWGNVATDGQLARQIENAPYLGLAEEMGARFMAHEAGGTRQYFRKVFDVADSDGDEVPDSVDLCPLDPTGPERDSNGNGQGDSCDLCAQCDNVAFGKPVTVSSVWGNRHADLGGHKVTNGRATCDLWHTVADQPSNWAEVDLGASYRVCSARWYNTANCGNYNAGVQAWHITVRDEDGEAVEVARGDRGNAVPATLPETVDFGDCHPARYIRFNIDRGYGGHAGIGELQVYGELREE